MQNIVTLVFLILAVALSSCQTAPKGVAKTLEPAFGSQFCETENAKIFIGYPTAKLDSCDVIGAKRVQVKSLPENTPINDSPWYGFYVKPKAEGQLRVKLKYRDGNHRYPPKISYDGTTWDWLPSSKTIQNSDDEVEIILPLDDRGFYVSAQEILTAQAHDNWLEKASQISFLTLSQIGASKEGHPIKKLQTPDSEKPYVILVGRQHPPELTGALAMIPFMETVFGDTELAKQFRDRFNIIAVPLLNPDGVDAGYWRHNFSGKDLNRDWGPFTEPETQAMKGEIDRLVADGRQIAFFLDFHSTRSNLLYTQTDEEVTSPAMFAHNWVTAVDARIDDKIYPFTRKPSPNSGLPTSKNYIYERFGIPAITYEVGDNTNRKALSDAAIVFAEEMMVLLMKEFE